MGIGAVSAERALAFARDVYYGHGKIEILPKVVVEGLSDIAVAFTPGVGHAVRLIHEHPEALHELTAKDNLIALVTDGTAVLGYGNVGPRAGMPVMEGKAIMFKLLAGIDCMPLCLESRDTSHLIDIIAALEPTFGGFNLEDVAAPGCFRVMSELAQRLPVPILHDDQYGTATVIAAGVTNALKVVGRKPGGVRAVVNGAGAAGTAAIEFLQALGIADIVAVDRHGILSRDQVQPRPDWDRLAARTNSALIKGTLTDALEGADLFIGLSVGNIVTGDMIRSMAKDPIVFALANPDPEILPDEAVNAGAAVAASGRFDYANHCNNVLAFPSLMRGALDTRSRGISRGMCMAAAASIAGAVPEEELGPANLLPSPLAPNLYPDVAEAVAGQSIAEGLARITPGPGEVAAATHRLRSLVEWRQRGLSRGALEA
jgi:malate dehydrogenase (oxaloacetate-decarboxylating)